MSHLSKQISLLHLALWRASAFEGFSLRGDLTKIFGTLFRSLLAAFRSEHCRWGSLHCILDEIKGGSEKFICAFGAAFWQLRSGEKLMRFCDCISQWAKFVPACHAFKVASRRV